MEEFQPKKPRVRPQSCQKELAKDISKGTENVEEAGLILEQGCFYWRTFMCFPQKHQIWTKKCHYFYERQTISHVLGCNQLRWLLKHH